jgi:hypothetical protein
MAQSGIDSRRDMEIMIAGGRVRSTASSPPPHPGVARRQRDGRHRPIKLKFNELPRVLLYPSRGECHHQRSGQPHHHVRQPAAG